MLVAAGGCRPAATTQTDLQPSQAHQIELLREQVQALETEKAMLEAKNQEIINRSEYLQKKVNDLEFTVAQHKDTIATLARAPIERDEMKKQLKEAQDENELLKKEIEALKKQLAAK